MMTNSSQVHRKCGRSGKRHGLKQVLGPQQNQHIEWISVETLKKIETKKKQKDKVLNSRARAAKREAQSQYNEIHQEIRRDIR